VLTKTLAWPAPPTTIRGRDDIVLWKQVRRVANIGETPKQRAQQSFGEHETRPSRLLKMLPAKDLVSCQVEAEPTADDIV
jgi:hypothetical protein